MLGRGIDLAGRFCAQARGFAFGGQPGGGHVREDDHVRLGRALAVGTDDVPEALDPRSFGENPDGGRLGEEAPAVRLAGVR